MSCGEARQVCAFQVSVLLRNATGSDGFTDKFLQTIRGQIIPMLVKLLHRRRRKKGKTFHFTSQIYHNSDTKICQRLHQKGELQISVEH